MSDDDAQILFGPGWPPFPDGALGWAVYEGGQFTEFVPNEPEVASAAERFADYVEAFTVRQASCGAGLFPLPESPGKAVALTGIPVHPSYLPYCAPVQGPAPAFCAREPHPGSPWHWDGRGTWWF